MPRFVKTKTMRFDMEDGMKTAEVIVMHLILLIGTQLAYLTMDFQTWH